MSTKTLSAPLLVRLYWYELLALFICIGLDSVELLFSPLMAPLVGDIIDLAGVVFCFTYFGWIGIFSIIELIPGFDALPIFTILWLIWYGIRNRNEKLRIKAKLEKWR